MSAKKKVLKSPLRVALVVLLIGVLARIVQWPFGTELVITSLSGIAILYAIRFWKKKPKVFLDYIKLILVLTCSTYGILTMFHLQYTIFFQIVMGGSFIFWFIMEGTAYFMDEDRRAKNSSLQIWWNIAMVLGTLCIIIGGLMKILQWEFASALLVLGIVMVALYIVKDLFSTARIKKEDSSSEEFQL
ncbi:hypothetical protein FK220_010835 [Flavobacteriaceae bacterium TP-CH-4]|uniref:Uncharacterized protein n=1 Tax=Pelagihabitans pacificus TaxID=2696054 RepID=A0A967E5V8_9FLAO|nr:hypothetical protein [Pelagihabitans pacificus]NHF59837.1 hypothetical protein [Pelagihabitans pacificus]